MISTKVETLSAGYAYSNTEHLLGSYIMESSLCTASKKVVGVNTSAPLPIANLPAQFNFDEKHHPALHCLVNEN